MDRRTHGGMVIVLIGNIIVFMYVMVIVYLFNSLPSEKDLVVGYSEGVYVGRSLYMV